MVEYVGHDGRPLDGNGHPVPEDPSQWSEQLRQYMVTYWFGAQEHADNETGHASLVASIPEVQHEDGSAIA